MQDYLATFTNTNGLGFPNTAAINASGGAATDGTEFTANMINDSMWGILQTLLDYTGQTPNGVVENPANSQILEAFRRFSIPGVQLPVFWNNDPAVLGIRAILLTGQGILKANYPELDAVVYVGDANNAAVHAAGGGFYHADDAAGTIPNTAGAYLILPDARGRVVRGLDLTGSVDPDGAGRYLGDLQLDSFQGFDRNIVKNLNSTIAAGTNSDWHLAVSRTGIGDQEYSFSERSEQPDILLAGDPIDSGNGTPRTSSESRMINLSANLMITY
jgi:hypothetical protein